jgi:hypothetical protein
LFTVDIGEPSSLYDVVIDSLLPSSFSVVVVVVVIVSPVAGSTVISVSVCDSEPDLYVKTISFVATNPLYEQDTVTVELDALCDIVISPVLSIVAYCKPCVIDHEAPLCKTALLYNATIVSDVDATLSAH